MRLFSCLSVLTGAFLFSQASAQDQNLLVLEHVYDNRLRLLVIERLGEHQVVGKIFTDMSALNGHRVQQFADRCHALFA